jgi:hypothetical protein
MEVLRFDIRKGRNSEFEEKLVKIFVDDLELSLKIKYGSMRLFFLDLKFGDSLHKFISFGFVIDDAIVPVGLVRLVVMPSGRFIFNIKTVQGRALRCIESILHGC